ncbi:MAG: hypothetical protein H7301_11735 [Cryobacterium sp.]|nr:hypothetical protein [Oligoflexia bacterium]
MHRRIDPQHPLTSLLVPNEQLEQAAPFFTSPPIESLEWLKELGEIARASFAPAVVEVVPTSAEISQAKELSNEEKLTAALLEYHRLRSPARGARSASRPGSNSDYTPADRTQAPSSQGFSAMEIPIVEDFLPKSPTNSRRGNTPIHTILKPGTKPPST